MKSSLSDSNHYRGISLYNPTCKVYDHAIICLCYKHLITSDMQFGFKANHSSVMRSLLYLDVINHIFLNGSNVYSCLLDASKAFDNVYTMANCLKYCWIKSSFLYYQIIIRLLY